MGGVVTCPENLAASAGAEILAAGGNAMDAAIATAFAQGVVGPKLSGIGGIGVLTAFNADLRSAECIRFWGTAGSKARPDQFVEDLLLDRSGTLIGVRGYRNAKGYESVLVPGFVSGMHAAYVRHGSGRVKWPSLIEPAIRFAENGFAVDEYLYHFWKPETPVDDICPPYETLTATAACAEIYTRDGKVLRPGERLVQRDYGRTLRRLAVEGPEVFYTGDIGRQVASDMERHGGLFTWEDLMQYRPLIGEPVRGTYRGYEILSDPPPGSGTLVVEALNILEGIDLRRLGWNSAEYLDLLARTFRYVFLDRRRFMADPRYLHVPVPMMISKEYAGTVRRDVLARASGAAAPEPLGHEGTTHVSVIDTWGNAAAITHTVCDASGVVIKGLGFMFNNDMSSFDPRPHLRNSIAPGKSPVNGGAPTLLARDGQVVLAIGSPAGPRKVTAVVQTILSLVDFGIDIQQALAADRIHQEVGPLLVEPSFPRDLADGLRGRGHEVRVTEYTARVAAVHRDPATGSLAGASDPRGGKGLAVVNWRIPGEGVQ